MISYKTYNKNNLQLLTNDYNDNSVTENNNTTFHKISSINNFTIKQKLSDILKTRQDKKHKKLFNVSTKIEHSIKPRLRQNTNPIHFFMIPKSDNFGTRLNIPVAILPNDLLFNEDSSSKNSLDILNNNCTTVFANIPKTYYEFHQSIQKNNTRNVEHNIVSIKNKIQNNDNNTHSVNDTDSIIYIHSGNLELISPTILKFMDLGYSIFCIHSKINIIQYYKNNDILTNLFKCNNTLLCNFNISLSNDDKNNATFFNVPKKYISQTSFM